MQVYIYIYNKQTEGFGIFRFIRRMVFVPYYAQPFKEWSTFFFSPEINFNNARKSLHAGLLHAIACTPGGRLNIK